MLVGKPVAMHPKFAPATGSQMIAGGKSIRLLIVTPPGVQFVIAAVPIGLARAEPVSVRKSRPSQPVARKNFARGFTTSSCDSPVS